MRRDERRKKELARKQGNIMEKFISTESLSYEYEKKRKQQDMLREMDRLHNGKGITTDNEHGIPTGLEV
jgi:hypothetical protein